MDTYQARIAHDLAPHAKNIDPRHVEAHMRAEYGTLDHLGGARWRRAVAEAADAAIASGNEVNERLARSYGL